MAGAERDTERKFIPLNILGWPKSLFKKERKEEKKEILLNIFGWPKSLFKNGRKEERKKEKNSFKYIGLSIMFI